MRRNPTRLARRACRVAVFASIVVALLPQPGRAIVGFNVRAGTYTDVGKTFVGGGIDAGIFGISVGANAEWVFVDNAKMYTLNLDGTVPLTAAPFLTIWGGGGIVSRTVDPDGLESDTKTGINLLAGAGLSLVPMAPFGQLKLILVDGDSEFVWAVGVRF